MRNLLYLACGLTLAFTLDASHASARQASGVPISVSVADAALDAARSEAYDLLNNRTKEGAAPGHYTAEARTAFKEAIDAATTAAEVEEATAAYQASVVTVKLSDADNEYWYYIASGPSVSYCENGVIYDMSSATGQQLKWNDKAPDSRAMWKFVQSSTEGKVNIVNRATGYYVRNTGANGDKVTSVANVASATPFMLKSLGEQRAFLIRESDSKMPVHADKIGVIVAWRTVALNSASVWHFDPVTADDLAYVEDNDENWTLVWSDEFNVDGPVDESNWTFEKGFVRNQEPQWYQPDNAVCSNGNLVITARKERVANPNYVAGSSSWQTNRQYAEYTSSSIITKDKRDLLYGRMEIRAKIPTSSGAWPAIWCKGYPETNGSWPACGEIDILEFYSKSIFANVAWSNATGGSLWRTVKTPFTHWTNSDPDWSDKYHIWRMDWDSLSIRLYLDDELLNVTSLERTVQPVGDFCKTENPFKTPMFALLNLALRSQDGIDESCFPLNYYVDYIRFYQKKNGSTSIQPSTTTEPTQLVIRQGGTLVADLRAFGPNVCLTIHAADGRIVRRFEAEAAQGTISLPALPRGIYIVNATDGEKKQSQKVMF